MDTESLQTLSAAALGLGVVFTGLGGWGLYYFNRAPVSGSQPSAEPELRSKIGDLEKANEELRDRLQVAESRRAKEREPIVIDAPEVIAPDEVPKESIYPRPVPVKTPPPPALASWLGESLFDELIESSLSAEPITRRSTLNENERLAITGILRKYAGRSIAIRSVAGDDTGFQLAWALKAAFAEAAWQTGEVEQVPYANPPVGLFITSGPGSAPEDAIIPHEALTRAGLDVSRCMDSNLKGDRAVLLVGLAAK